MPLVCFFLIFSAIGVWWWRVARINPESEFSVAINNTGFRFPFVSDPAWFWLEKNGGLYPANCVAFIRFQNHRPAHVMVDSYWVETEIDGKWERVPLPPITEPEAIYAVNFGTNFHKALTFKTDQHIFDSLIETNNFAPGEAIYAWVFWGMPTNGISNKLRMYVGQGNGKESVAPINFLSGGHLHLPTFSYPDERDIGALRRHEAGTYLEYPRPN